MNGNPRCIEISLTLFNITLNDLISSLTIFDFAQFVDALYLVLFREHKTMTISLIGQLSSLFLYFLGRYRGDSGHIYKAIQ